MKATSIRLDDDTNRQIDDLAAWLGLSKTAVIRMGIKTLHWRFSELTYAGPEELAAIHEAMDQATPKETLEPREERF